MTNIKLLPISEIEVNKGQMVGLPKNPRFIRDERFESLKKSISDAPEMLNLRELLVYPFEGKYIVIGGNMRLRACKDLGYKEVPCKIIPEDTPVMKLREYTIKDNEAFGQNDWDAFANDWDTEELKGWGMENSAWDEVSGDIDIDSFLNDIPEDKQKEETQDIKLSFPMDVDMSVVKEKIKEVLTGYIYTIK